jgi:3'-phosphoadenosine 5'-phosphosulfate sulfotransferase (PAPS reductase)/FAD synthetase
VAFRSEVSAIPRKQRSTQADWLDALRSAYETPDRSRAERLVGEAAERIARRCDGLRASFGWSGGKDSQALRVVAEAAGVDRCVLVISELEYPAFLGWATDNMPWGCHVDARPLDLYWLYRNPEMLFPQDATTASKWFRQVQHAGQRAYCREDRIDVLLMGRRRADGNYLGAGGEYRDRSGFVRSSPIGDWSHEDVLCVLGAYDMSLPPCYGWPRGFRVGTGPWPARQWCDDRDHE